MIIPIFGRIGEDTFNLVSIMTNNILSTDILILIDSVGGNLYYTLEIIKIINGLGLNTTGYVSGSAFSGAFILLQNCCNEKIAHPNARFMMHYPRYINGDVVKCNGPSRIERICFRKHRSFLKTLSYKTGIPFKKIEKYNRRETVFNADQAQSLGFVDDISFEYYKFLNYFNLPSPLNFDLTL